MDRITDNLATSLVTKTVDYSYEQMLIPAISESKLITQSYTEEIWDSVVNKESNATYRECFLTDMQSFFIEMTVFKSIASEKDITLSQEETRAASLAADTFYQKTCKEVGQLSDMDKGEVSRLFADYALARKTKEKLIEENVPEVAESEARIMDFHVIEVSDQELAESLLERLNQGEDCYRLAAQYSENENILQSIPVDEKDQTVKNALCTLDQGGISPVLEEKGKYILYKCINSYDKEATRKNKEKIKRERESRFLQDMYQDYLTKNQIVMDELVFKKVRENAFITFEGQDFFTTFQETWENEGL